MAKTIRDPSIATANWQSRASAAAGFYASQVASSVWKVYAASPQSEANYAAGVQAAIASKARLNAVNASSDQAWQAGVAAVGQTRFSDGIAHSVNRMSAAMTKVIGAEKTIIAALPARGPRGSAQNFTRSTQFGQALTKLRGTLGATGIPRA